MNFKNKFKKLMFAAYGFGLISVIGGFLIKDYLLLLIGAVVLIIAIIMNYLIKLREVDGGTESENKTEPDRDTEAGSEEFGTDNNEAQKND